MRSLIALTSFLLVCRVADTAHACGPTPPPYLTVDTVIPSDGATGFPRNAAVRIGLKSWPTDDFETRTLDIRVTRVDTGAAAEGYVDEFPTGSGFAFWSPSQPLLANTQYRVEVQTTTRPRADIAAPVTSTTTFTTSDQLLGDLELTGQLHATLRHGSAPVQKCGPCGDCMKIGERPALFADVELPRVSAGFDAYGYRAWFTLNDNTAPVFSGPGEGKLLGNHEIVLPQLLQLDPSEARTVAIELPREDHPYSACFGFNAWDPIGQAKSAEALCLSAAEVDAAFAKLDQLGSAGQNAASGGGSAPDSGVVAGAPAPPPAPAAADGGTAETTQIDGGTPTAQPIAHVEDAGAVAATHETQVQAMNGCAAVRLDTTRRPLVELALWLVGLVLFSRRRR